MKTKINNNRLVIALCMDKERDEKLINYLNSKVNKSDFIRNVLNNELLKEQGVNDNQDKLLTKTLLEVLTNLTSLSDKLISLSNNNLLYGTNLQSPNFIKNIDNSRVVDNAPSLSVDSTHNLTNFNSSSDVDANDNTSSDVTPSDDNILDESDILYSNLISSIVEFK